MRMDEARDALAPQALDALGAMFANYLIGLREGLEATLIVTILIAYLIRADRRDKLHMVALGVIAALAISVAFGAILTFTSQSLSFEQQETFGGTLSIIAVGFVTGMVFWMRNAARGIRAELDGKVGAALAVGSFAVAMTAFLAVGREGLETALFFWSAAQAAGSTAAPLLGFLLGIGTAVVLGWLLYRRAIHLDLGRFFTWTGAGLIVVAAGVLAYGVHDLQEASVLPGLNNLAFDVSAQIRADSWYGSLLKGIFNFSPETTLLQAIIWTLYIVPVMALFLGGADFVRGLRRASTQAAPIVLGLIVLVIGGCAKADGSKRAGGISVAASDNSCKVDTKAVAAGTHVVNVENKGSRVTEVYVYAAGDRIMGEIENVTPGIRRDFKVSLTPGRYQFACKPGMVGDGIRQPLTVTGAAQSVSTKAQLTQAVSGYRSFVEAQTKELRRKTAIFAAAIHAGDIDKAKALYAGSRIHYERIEPIAESFPDLDTKIDIRAGDTPKGQQWTGFHRIERDLWQKRDVNAAKPFAKILMKDVATLDRSVRTTKITPEQLANGARQLMDEVATSKITGEEDRYSHTDLEDFQGNLDGARAAYVELRPIVVKREPALAQLVDRRFSQIQAELDKYRSGGTYVLYNKLTPPQIRLLAATVDAVSEPLSRVSGVVLA